MNSAKHSPLILIKERLHIIVGGSLGMLVAVAAGLFAVGYSGNPLKSLMILLGIVSMVIATLRPKAGLYLLIFSSTILDFIKRLLLVFGVTSLGDVAAVLSAAPMILLGIFVGSCVLYPIFTKRMLGRVERRLALVALTLIGLTVALGLKSANTVTELLGTAANQSAYALLVPSVYVLYRDKKLWEIEKLLRFAAFVYIPVALYGIYQFWFGYNQFEINYLRSGLTITELNLYDLHPRPFSTLNSPHAYSTIMWFMTVCCIGLGFQMGGVKRTPRWLPILYISGLLLSFVRGAIVLAGINLLMGRWFKTRKGALIFYCLSLTAIVLMIAFSQTILERLEWFQRYMPNDKDWQKVAFRLGTMSDRFQGYQMVLLNPNMYTFFGHGVASSDLSLTFDEEGYNHDVLSSILFRFGIFGVVVALSLCGYTLWKLHSAIWRVENRERKALGTMLVSIIVLILMSHIGGPSSHVFPINLFIWLFLAIVVTICDESGEKEATPSFRPTGNVPRDRSLAIGQQGVVR